MGAPAGNHNASGKHEGKTHHKDAGHGARPQLHVPAVPKSHKGPKDVSDGKQLHLF